MANQQVTPYSSPPTASVDIDSSEEILLGRIPTFDDPSKGDYVGYRAVGFNDIQSAQLANVTPTQVTKWMLDDAVFKDWVTTKIQGLQRTVGKDIIRYQFSRNMHLVLRLHYDLLYQAVTDWENMPASKFEMLKTIAGRYTGTGLQNMLKATSHDIADSDQGSKAPELHVHIDGEAVESAIARLAGSRNLLDQFTDHGDKFAEDEPNIVEGDFEVKDGSGLSE